MNTTQAHAKSNDHVTPHESNTPRSATSPVFADMRPETVSQRKLSQMVTGSPQVTAQLALRQGVGRSPAAVAQRADLTAKRPTDAGKGERSEGGLPATLRSGIESLSGMSMGHVKVYYNSKKPAQLLAHAYAQGSEIHLGAGQEKHLPHEAWHVVQQAQGRVRPTLQMKAGAVNDDPSLEKEADMMGLKAMQFKSGHDARNVLVGERAAGKAGQHVDGLCGPSQALQLKVALLSNAIDGGMVGSAPVQRVLNQLPGQVNGPNGLKNIYVDTDDNSHYRNTVGGAGTQINLLAVGAVQGKQLRAVRALPIPHGADHYWITQTLTREALLLDLDVPQLLQVCGTPPAAWAKPVLNASHIACAAFDQPPAGTEWSSAASLARGSAV